VLEKLAARYGETAHYAVLDGRSIVYRSKVDSSSGTVKLTSTIGGRNPAHCTAVGRLLLSYALPDDDAVRSWVAAGELVRLTDRTKTGADELCEELRLIRSRGFSVENQETEQGIGCLALPAFLTSPTVPSGAISITTLLYRTPLRSLIDDVSAIREIIGSRWAGARTPRPTS
jgi:IclR family acetate operon transcriptional repressor